MWTIDTLQRTRTCAARRQRPNKGTSSASPPIRDSLSICIYLPARLRLQKMACRCCETSKPKLLEMVKVKKITRHHSTPGLLILGRCTWFAGAKSVLLPLNLISPLILSSLISFPCPDPGPSLSFSLSLSPTYLIYQRLSQGIQFNSTAMLYSYLKAHRLCQAKPGPPCSASASSSSSLLCFCSLASLLPIGSFFSSEN